MTSSLENKVVVITGGSAGLGKALAREFANQQAIVVLLARSREKLEEATKELTSAGLRARYWCCDVTSDESVKQVVDDIARELGRIDVWVNNVGVSTRSLLLESTVEQYQELIDINFMTAVRCVLAAMPWIEKTGGQFVNIGSLASKTGWPNMTLYSASKHALAAFSHQLRLEAPAGVNCLHVCPGPIQRPDAGNRYDQQAAGLDESARAPGAGAKIKGIKPEVLANKVVQAVQKRKKELVVPWKTRILFALLQISPSLGDWVLRSQRKK